MYKNSGAILLILLTTYYLLHTTSVDAYTMSNDNYMLDSEQIDRTQQDTAPAEILEITPTHTPAPGPKFKILNSKENNSISLSISDTLIDLGIISPANPILRTNIIGVSSTMPFSLFAYESNAFLDRDSNTTIPDTTCDNGSCSEKQASLWENNLTYGFGYRCDNLSANSCLDDFLPPNFYKQFADLSHFETMQSLTFNSNSKKVHLKITYKVNTSQAQKEGNYQTVVSYILAPGY